MNKINIGVTDCSKYENYARWIQAYGTEVAIIKLSEKTNNVADAQRCHGVVFTGGEDVHPRLYGKPEYISFCHQDDINERRDEFELKLMAYTEHNHIPVLGICRGLQVFNVFKGGTLVPDIPAWGKPTHAKLPDGSDRYHPINVVSGAWLEKLVGQTKGDANSNHHQSIDRMGDGLVASAFTEDGIVEAADRKEVDGKGFLCLVQWHPERMNDQQNPFVYNIREAFIKATKALVLK
jgi:putative glutamine amidotransferase